MFYHIIEKHRNASIYLIQRKDYTDPRFFLQEWDHEHYDFVYARWTAKQVNANIFTTEQMVEEFKHHYLRHQPCEIIRIKK